MLESPYDRCFQLGWAEVVAFAVSVEYVAGLEPVVAVVAVVLVSGRYAQVEEQAVETVELEDVTV